MNRPMSLTRMLIRIATTGFALAMIAGPSNAQTTLRWKFQPGVKLHYEVEQKVITKTHTEAQDTRVSQIQTLNMTLKVKSLDDTGKAQIAQTFDRLRLKEDGPRGKLDFDSDKDLTKKKKDTKDADAQDPNEAFAESVGPMMKALIGAEFLLTFNDQGEVLDAKMPESLSKIFKESASQGGFNAEEFVKHNLMQTAIKLPKTPVKEGEDWKVSVDVPMPTGVSKQTRTYTYKGQIEKRKAKLDIIDLAVTSKFVPGEDAPIKLVFKSSTSKGNFLFDNVHGFLHDSSLLNEDQVEIENQGQVATQNVQVAIKFTFVSASDQ